MPISVLGRKPYNNGVECKYFYEGSQPENGVYGLLKRSKEEISKSNKLREQTCLNTYGCRNVRQNKDVQLKAKNTCYERYGDENYNNRDKMLKTAWDNAGCREEFYQNRLEKTIETCLSKYNCENYVQSEEFQRKYANNRRYIFGNEKFDSSGELYLWIYAIDNNIPIKHLPCKLSYFYDGKTHYYFPDFELNGELIDVKGPQFISENKELVALYNSDDSEKISAKGTCMVENNVKLFSIEDIEPIIKGVDNKYGKDYLKQYRFTEGGDV